MEEWLYSFMYIFFFALVNRDLNGLYLQGILAPELGNLTHLRFLWVSTSSLTFMLINQVPYLLFTLVDNKGLQDFLYVLFQIFISWSYADPFSLITVTSPRTIFRAQSLLSLGSLRNWKCWTWGIIIWKDQFLQN